MPDVLAFCCVREHICIYVWFTCVAPVCVCVCVCTFVRACVRACVRVFACVPGEPTWMSARAWAPPSLISVTGNSVDLRRIRESRTRGSTGLRRCRRRRASRAAAPSACKSGYAKSQRKPLRSRPQAAAAGAAALRPDAGHSSEPRHPPRARYPTGVITPLLVNCHLRA